MNVVRMLLSARKGIRTHLLITLAFALGEVEGSKITEMLHLSQPYTWLMRGILLVVYVAFVFLLGNYRALKRFNELPKEIRMMLADCLASQSHTAPIGSNYAGIPALTNQRIGKQLADGYTFELSGWAFDFLQRHQIEALKVKRDLNAATHTYTFYE